MSFIWTKGGVDSIVAEIEKENSVFSNKSILDTASGILPKKTQRKVAERDFGASAAKRQQFKF